MSSPEIDKLKSLVVPELLLKSLGFRFKNTGTEELRGVCKLHGGDNPTAFCFRKNTGRFYCFTKQCELDVDGQPDNDVIALVRKVNKCSFTDALKFLSELTGYDVFSAEEDISFSNKLKRESEKNSFIERNIKRISHPQVSEEIVEEYIRNGSDYFSSLGIPDYVIKEFELGSFVDTEGEHRASIPIRDEEGVLVSISGRKIGEGEPRYKLLRNFKRRKVLYNLHRAVSAKETYSSTIIIVEGFKALWHVFSCGFKNVAAVMSFTISSDQVNLLVKSGFLNCILLLDGDEAGRKGMKSSIKALRGKLNCQPAYLPQGKSPDDISLDELYEFLNVFQSIF